MTSVFNTSSQQSSLLSLLKAGVRKNASANQQASNSVMAAIAKADPEKARELKEKQDKANSVLQQLQANRANVNAERKETARQKVEQLKKQIQALRMMAAGDPKAAARRAAQLSRELAAATKEYASAGGNAGELGGISTATPQASQQAAATENTNAGSDTASAQAGTATQAAAPVAAQDGEATTDADATANPQDDTAQTPTSIRDSVNEKINEANRKQAEREADTLFAKEVRSLLNALKQIVKSAQQKMRDDGDSGDTQDTRDAQNALRDVEKSLGDITGGTAAGTFSAINISV